MRYVSGHFRFRTEHKQILRLAYADLAEGCSIRYSRASRAQTLVPQKVKIQSR